MSLPNRPRFNNPKKQQAAQPEDNTNTVHDTSDVTEETKNALYKHPSIITNNQEPKLARAQLKRKPVTPKQPKEAPVSPPRPHREPTDTTADNHTTAASEPVRNPVEETPIALDFSSTKHASQEPTVTPIKESFSPEVRASIKRLFSYLYDDITSEITINGPQEIGFKQAGQRSMDTQINFQDTDTYHRVINKCLLPFVSTNETVNPKSYLVEGQLTLDDEDDPSQPPMIARVHIIAPPAVKNAKITIAKKSRKKYSIDDFANAGTMTLEMANLLKCFAKGRATVVFSGVSGSGKTTLLESLSREFDPSDRVILIEDTPELSIPVADLVDLHSQQPKPTDDPDKLVTLEWLVRQANRMRPDRIIVGEVRGGEMAEFLIAANSGADGSMTTVHASSPTESISKMLSLSLKNRGVKSELAALRDIATTVQIIVQLTLIDGKHIVEQIEEVSNIVNPQNLNIQTTTLYKYDRNRGIFISPNRMSDRLQDFLRQRGVQPPLPANARRF